MDDMPLSIVYRPKPERSYEFDALSFFWPRVGAEDNTK